MSNIHAIPTREPQNEDAAADEGCATLHAISDALAILDAIDQGGLFDAVPENPGDRARFQTAISLLDILENRLRDAVGNPEHLISDECRCTGHQHCGPKFS